VHHLRRTYHRLKNRRTRWIPWVTRVMWNLSFFRLVIVLVLVQDRCIVCAKYTIGPEIILDALDGIISERLKWKLHSEIVLILMQDRCTVYVEHTISSEIVFDAPDGTPRWRGSCGISLLFRFGTVLVSVQDRCIICASRTIGSEIILDAPDGTTRWCGSCGISLLSIWRQC
jgi:hypothetical protein